MVMNGMRGMALGILAAGPPARALTGVTDSATLVEPSLTTFGKLLNLYRVFLNGALMALAVVFYIQQHLVEGQIQYIVQSVTTEEMTMDQKAVALLHEANAIVRFGLRNAKSSAPAPVQGLLLRGFDESMFLPNRYCGDAAEILYRLLDGAGIDSRIAQMRCAKNEGCHILVEAHIYGRWVVLDPLYGITFRNRNNQLATFREVSEDWDYFRRQTPSDYDPTYKYEGVRYTNWEKIPILMPLLHRVLVGVLGENRTGALSLRTYLAATYNLYMFGCLAGLLLVNGIRFAPKANRSSSASRKTLSLHSETGPEVLVPFGSG